ncbi:hypothetical protein ACI49N_003113 [Acinetobacter baumannii]|uniref:hypothetical protein n=1 Tax=Acinetobacter TaxID=469 RepID=UPI0012C7CCD7|nr:hypothetical protein [Acinetobacter sp.]EJB8489889.1 hypothetical protein [Acinetobacter baumannii]EKV7389846.1 hypothetical protein [Acinetobacter baumannii]EKW3202900.1 hypothetical protein [Acinetobacter baumannii]EKX0107478.1 hypothetical protein [Acinetobacter baumannii]ELB5354678.1 hypothetical protein [Acinetobacter baumannii]
MFKKDIKLDPNVLKDRARNTIAEHVQKSHEQIVALEKSIEADEEAIRHIRATIAEKTEKLGLAVFAHESLKKAEEALAA